MLRSASNQILIFLFLPETKQRTLEELDYVFGVTTRRHASYQVGTAAPWFFKRWILFKKEAYLPPLYKFDYDVFTDPKIKSYADNGFSKEV